MSLVEIRIPVYQSNILTFELSNIIQKNIHRCTVVGNPGGGSLGFFGEFFWEGYLGLWENQGGSFLLHFYVEVFKNLYMGYMRCPPPLPPPCVHLCERPTSTPKFWMFFRQTLRWVEQGARRKELGIVVARNQRAKWERNRNRKRKETGTRKRKRKRDWKRDWGIRFTQNGQKEFWTWSECKMSDC